MTTNQEEIIQYDQFLERAQNEAEKEHNEDDKKKSFRNSMRMSIAEFVHHKKNRSIHVILSMANSTIGSVALVLPASVLQGGLILAIICMTIIGFINYVTCYFISVYQREDEIDLASIVRRILGPKWKVAFILSSAFQLFVACIIYFLLINSICYPIIQFIMHKCGTENYGSSKEIVFDKFSIQYQAMILFVPVFLLCSLKELNFIVKLGRIGVTSIFAYGIFLLYCFIENISDGNVSEYWDEQMSLFSKNIVGVAGPFSFAFFVHTIVSQITATNINFKENPRNIGYGYLIVYFAYAYFSIVGSIGVVGRKTNYKDASNINDFFGSDDVGPVVVDILYLIHLITALPTLCHVSRSQFFILIQGETKPVSQFQMLLYNATFCCLGLLFQILCIDPSVIIEVNGSVCCFFIVYIIPFFFRLRESKRLAQGVEDSVQNNLVNYTDSTNSKQEDPLDAKRRAPIGILEKIFWAFAMLVGLFLAVVTLLSIFGVNLG
ncbi:transmembrane amino acid transporter protein (macronuclear) [Tetrahymena thermophila SB210]|uniref:Transmembrane amino acid transporter protein n=1 Tax=Tetrahymena thermophila (strain SB210) TaxID=312017 RepID=W7XEX7_TETTS|nr:transmembrane amino acid transporter protein [Tetrahymena thermophila SB210]EWS72541.1 transmembrane amino acid transporter protein [Tetrahymena thermophila SB210]|eukprot:XP_012654921.1 transmembrane amino acid transporter protein [Tetrahymena thermophila SB210]